MGNRTRLTLVVLLFLSALIPLRGGARKDKKDVVYVCACLKTKSCPCLTVAKMEGPCACGTNGGPPLKAVAKDSDWVKENLEALAK